MAWHHILALPFTSFLSKVDGGKLFGCGVCQLQMKGSQLALLEKVFEEVLAVKVIH